MDKIEFCQKHKDCFLAPDHAGECALVPERTPPKTRQIIFDTPPAPFKELPKVPQCFCAYPIIYSTTYDMKLKQWVWRLDMEAVVGGKVGHLQIPGPFDPQGNPAPFNVEYLALALNIFAEKLKGWIIKGEPIPG